MISTIKENLNQKCVLDLGNATCSFGKEICAPGSKKCQSSLEKGSLLVPVGYLGYRILSTQKDIISLCLTNFAHYFQISKMSVITLHAKYFYYKYLYNSLRIHHFLV